MGVAKEYVWEAMKDFSPELIMLQQKTDTCNQSTHVACEVADDFWETLAKNVLELVEKLDDKNMVSYATREFRRNFLQC